jgi:hypothetical protein
MMRAATLQNRRMAEWQKATPEILPSCHFAILQLAFA